MFCMYSLGVVGSESVCHRADSALALVQVQFKNGTGTTPLQIPGDWVGLGGRLVVGMGGGENSE